MNKITAKSILLPTKKYDGLRVCVMKRTRPEYDFDIWLPKLAPTEKLLNDYVIKKKISWKSFASKYTKQILKKNSQSIKLLLLLSKNYNITLLCSEESVLFCHRKLIIDECKRRVSKLQVVLE